MYCYDCIARICEEYSHYQHNIMRVAMDCPSAITVYHGRALCAQCLDKYMHEV